MRNYSTRCGGAEITIERKTLRAQVRDERLYPDALRRSSAWRESRSPATGCCSWRQQDPFRREALIGLQSEGQITSENGKGFRFVRLSAEEFRDLAPVMAALEGLALELTPAAERVRLGAEKPTAMAQEFSANVAEHSLVVTRDDEWHAVMLSGCPNSRLLEMIERTVVEATDMRAPIGAREKLGFAKARQRHAESAPKHRTSTRTFRPFP